MTGRQAIGAIRVVLILMVIVVAPLGARAAPYADMVMDARSGEVLHSTNADSRLHPASLTKMMTLYVAFEAIRMGEISLDTMVTISRKAAAEPPSKLGLRAGQRIQLRYLIRAAAVKSANDAATAIGEAVSGSEAAFARRMNRTARALGMTRTTFKNANGLTEEGHLSTARDMTILGRHLFYDYPQYYNIFSRRSTDAGIGEVANTNRRFLDAYEGADGIKTGYTRAAGFNLVASAERGRKRIIATVFGGASTAARNARMAELMDLGFNRAPNRVAVSRPQLPRYDGPPESEASDLVADAGGAVSETTKIVRVSGAVTRSVRPRLRGSGGAEPAAELLAAIESDVTDAVAAAAAEAAATAAAEAAALAVAQSVAVADVAAVVGPEIAEAVADAALPEAPGEAVEEDAVAVARAEAEATMAIAAVAEAALAPEVAELAEAAQSAPPPRPGTLAVEVVAVEATEVADAGAAEAADDAAVLAEVAEEAVVEVAEADPAEAAAPAPAAPAATFEVANAVPVPGDEPQPDFAALLPAASAPAGPALRLAEAAAPTSIAAPVAEVILLAAAVAPPAAPEPVLRPEPTEAEVVTRVSTSGGRHYGISLGRFGTRTEAEKALIRLALADMGGLGPALRRVVQRGGGFEANFMGMTEDEAALACRRMGARGLDCTPIGG